MEFNLIDLTAILFELSVIILCWIVVIHSYHKIRSVNVNEIKNNVRNSFAIGMGSGLVVFVLSFFAQNFSTSKIDFSSISDLSISILSGLIGLVLQLSLIVALISLIMAITFKDFLE